MTVWLCWTCQAVVRGDFMRHVDAHGWCRWCDTVHEGLEACPVILQLVMRRASR